MPIKRTLDIQIGRNSVRDFSASTIALEFTNADTALIMVKYSELDYTTNLYAAKDFTADGGAPQALRLTVRADRYAAATLYTFQDVYNNGDVAAFEDTTTGQITYLVSFASAAITAAILNLPSITAWLEFSYLDANGSPSTLLATPITINNEVDDGAAGTPPPTSPTYLTAAEINASFFSKSKTDAWAVLSATTGTPPALTGGEDRYIIPAAGTTGAWVGQEGKVAVDDASWTYYAPEEGWFASVVDVPGIVQYISAAWAAVPYISNSVSEIGEAIADTDHAYGQNASDSNADVKILFSRVWTWIGVKFAALTTKATPIDADSITMIDSADSNALKRVTYAAFKAALGLAASAISFVNTTTQMTAVNVQTAIDEFFKKYMSNKSTGHSFGGELSINSGDNTKFDVAAGSCDIVDSYTDPENPTFVKVSWTASTAQTVTNLATQPFTVISIKKGTTTPADGELVETALDPDGEDRRDYNALGILIHDSGTFISIAKTIPLWNQDTGLALWELGQALGGSINMNKGNNYSANGANLKIDKSVGLMNGLGYNWENNKKDPNRPASAAQTALSFALFERSTALPVLTSDINVTQYDPAGTGLVSVKAGWFTTPRIFLDPNTELTIVQHSQHQYDSLLKATKAAINEEFTNVSAVGNLNCRTILVVQQGATDLTDPTVQKFISLGALGCKTLNSIPTYSRFAEIIETGDGLSYQKQSVTFVLDTGVIYADVEADGGGDIIYVFQQREYTLDCTTGAGVSGRARIALTAGTAPVPVKNWVSVIRSGDVAILQAGTSVPTGEYGMVETVFLPDTATFTARNDSPYGSRDHIDAKSVSGRGLMATVLSKLRDLSIGYISGLTPVPDFATASEIDLTIASGVVKEIYEQTTDALQVTVDGALVVNDQTTSYTPITDLADIVTDTLGGSLTSNNTYYQLVIAISGNVDGTTQMLVNKPTGSYSSPADAFNDINGYSVTSFPASFDTVSLVCALVIRTTTGLIYSNAATAFGVDFIDLRGVDPGGSSSGSGAASVTSFSDAAFSIFSAANSWLQTFSLSGLSADRAMTLPDHDTNLTQLFGSATGIGMGANPDASALLDVSSTTQGFKAPSMTTTQRDAIGTPVTALMIHNITTAQYEWYNGAAWAAVGPAGSGEANTLESVGAGTSLVGTQAGTILKNKSLTSSGSSVTLTNSATEVNVEAIKTAPYRNQYIDAAAMVSRTTNGAEALTKEFATNDIMIDYYAFDSTTEEGVQFKWALPDEWDRGTIKLKFYWDGAATASGNVVWGVSAGALSNDDAIDAALGSEVTATDTLIAVGDMHISPATAAVTIGGSPALGDMAIFQVVAKTSGTIAVDQLLLGVSIQYKESSTEPVIW